MYGRPQGGRIASGLQALTSLKLGNMNWNDLLAAFALYLVLEGIVPFVNPGGFKHFMRQMIELPDRQLRNIGLGSMIAGAVLLYLVR